MDYLKLFKWRDIFLVILTQYLIKFYLFETFGISITLNGFGLFLVSLSSVCFLMAYQVISQVYQAEAIAVNDPDKLRIGKEISEKKAYNLFVGLSIVAVGIGFYLSNLIGKPIFTGFFIMVSAVCYLQASFLKNYAVVSNIMTALLAVLVIAPLALFDLFPAITPQNQTSQHSMLSLLIDYAVFGFLLSFLFDLLSDQRNLNGHHKIGINTLPIIIGQKRTNIVVVAFTAVTIIALGYYIYSYLMQNTYWLSYSVLVLMLPLVYVLIRSLSATKQADYAHNRFMVKLILFATVLSMGLYQYIV